MHTLYCDLSVLFQSISWIFLICTLCVPAHKWSAAAKAQRHLQLSNRKCGQNLLTGSNVLEQITK